MRHIIDLVTGQIIQSADQSISVNPVTVKAGGLINMEVQFVRDHIPELLPDGYEDVLEFQVKASGVYDGDPLVSVRGFSKPDSASGYYTAVADFSDPRILEIFHRNDGSAANDVKEIPASYEFAWAGSVGEKLTRTTNEPKLTIRNWIISGEDAPTGSEVGRVIYWLDGITSLLGGSASLESLATDNSSRPTGQLVGLLSDGVEYHYQLQESTDETDSPEVIRVSDYADGNERVWRRVSAYFDGSGLDLGSTDNLTEGASNLYFTEERALSATDSTYAKKVNLAVNVKDFGAVGDGVADDTDAIAEVMAIVNASGGSVFFPKGTYLTTTCHYITKVGVQIIGAGADATIIRAIGNDTGVFCADGDFNQLQFRDFQMLGTGLGVSTAVGLEFRGNTVGGSSCDFTSIKNVLVKGFGIAAKMVAVANSSVTNCGFSSSTLGVLVSGNSNSLTFRSCAFTSNDTGVELAGGRSCSLINCDYGGEGQTLQVKITGGNGHSIRGGNMEVYGGSHAIEFMVPSVYLTIDSLTITGYGTPTNYALKMGSNAVLMTNLVRNGVLGSAIKQTSPAASSLIVVGVGIKVDAYNGDGGAFVKTYIANVFPTDALASGEVAHAGNHGKLWRRVFASGADDVLNLGVLNADGSYAFANLLDWYSYKKTYGLPAGLSANTFLGTQTIQNAVNPTIRLVTSTYTTGQSAAMLGIATANDNIATGALAGDTTLSARSGGDLVFATSMSGVAQSVKWKILKTGELVHISGVKLIVGAGSPEGVVTAIVGSTFTRTDGGVGTTFYRKESGTGNTGWVAK